MERRPADARRLRVVRAGAASGVAVTSAATAHTLSGGDAPAAWLMLAVTLLAWPLAVALIGRRPSVIATASTIAMAQVLLHGAFALVGTGAPGGHLHVFGHVHGAVLPPASLTQSAAFDAGMTAGHIVAAAVTTILVWHGERMLRVVAAGIRRALTARRSAVLLAAPAPMPAVRTAAPRPATVVLSGLSRRGPPR